MFTYTPIMDLLTFNMKEDIQWFYHNITTLKLEHMLVHSQFIKYSPTRFILPTGLKRLKFDPTKNNKSYALSSAINKVHRSVDFLPSTLQELILGDSFDQPVDNLPAGLKILRFGREFNQSVDNLPTGLEVVQFGTMFSRHIGRLPGTVKYLALGVCFTRKIRRLPSAIMLVYYPQVPTLVIEHSVKQLSTNQLHVWQAAVEEYLMQKGIKFWK